MSADSVGTRTIMAETGTAKATVWRWQARFMAEGVEGLLHDKRRPPGQPPVAEDKASAVVTMTLMPPPHEATDWTIRAMTKAAGLAVSTVQKIWKAHGLASHRWRQFKLSNDPPLVEGFFATLTRRRLAQGRLPIRRRSLGRHRPLHRRTQPGPKALHLAN